MRRCLLLLPLLTGCATTVRPPASVPVVAVAAGYRLGCPDVVAVRFADRPRWDAVASVDVDGTLPLGPAGRPNVIGRTIEEAAEVVADAAELSPGRVTVEVLSAKAARVFVTGPANRRTRPLPYPGPLPVDEFLRTAAILSPDADPTAVYLLRPNVVAGGRPEVFQLPTPLTLLPADHIYVGESRPARFARLLPKWLQPYYRRLVNLEPQVR